MPREAVSFVVEDLSAFARSLARALAEREEAKQPGHVEMLNLIARAAGHRNLQALQASLKAPAAPLGGDLAAQGLLIVLSAHPLVPLPACRVSQSTSVEARYWPRWSR